MLLSKILKGVRKLQTLYYSSCENRRFLSMKNVQLSEDKKQTTREFVKPFTKEELPPLESNFLQDLFANSINKNIFRYPSVLREENINVVLNHSVEVERLLRRISQDEVTDEVLKELRKLELFGLSVPQKYGGSGYNETECKFLQECTGVSPKIGRFLGYNENLGVKLLERYGTEEQKQKYLPLVAEGKRFLSLAYLENGPLIDVSKFEGFAVDDEVNKRYILTADKKWVHSADKSDLFLVVVKSTELYDKQAAVKVKLNIFLAEKDSPGLTVHKLVAKHAQENDLFDVTLKDVALPYSNLVGGKAQDGFLILKDVLSHNNLTDAVMCCCIMKQIIHEVTKFMEDKSLHDTSIRGHVLIQENLASLTIYTYALESAIYFATGRFDSHEDPDLFNETVMAKALAIEFLQKAIRKYSEILGRDSLKSSGVLKKAIDAMQYYTVFDENIEYLKMMVAAEGITKAAQKIASRVKVLRNPFDYNKGAFKRIFFDSEDRSIKKHTENYKFSLELHESLSEAAKILESNIGKLHFAIEEMFISHGKKALNNEHAVIKFADMAAYIYALVACLSRASCAVCYDFEGFEMELDLAIAFAHTADAKINEMYSEELKFVVLNNLSERLGKMTFSQKKYPAEHPLTRTF